jgi:hypothetical protein
VSQPVSATLPVVRALLDEARRKSYPPGVLGVRAKPEWTGPESFSHHDGEVRVVACESALAVREALLAREPGGWLVVLTDRSDKDLGAGILSHLAWHRLRTPDPWEAVRHRFAATGIDPGLTARPAHRELAAGLLAAAPLDGWPPAPGGVLTVEHALASVAREHLDLGDPHLDATSVLTWSTQPEAPTRVVDLRHLAGDTLVDVLLTWSAERTGAAAPAILPLLRAGRVLDLLPLGLVAGLVADGLQTSASDTVQAARDSLIRLEGQLGSPPPAAHVLRAWGSESAAVLSSLLAQDAPTAHRVLTATEQWITTLQAERLTDQSDLLPGGLTRRLQRLADDLRSAVVGQDGDPDAALVLPSALAAVERSWSAVTAHRLTTEDPRARPFAAAVRLVRWLSQAQPAPADLGGLVDRHNDTDAWVDAAINDAYSGVGEADLGQSLELVLAQCRRRRDRHDVSFAQALAAHTSAGAPGLLGLEDLVADVVLPLAKRTPVLFLVLDGMSVAVGHEVLADVLGRPGTPWSEALLPGQQRRGTALAVLPTLTEVSRTSLYCGTLTRGTRDTETRGFATLASAHGVLNAKLFHKKPLEGTRAGFAVADDVGAALDDITGSPLVSCVLNTIDDALDRSDPAGIEWTGDAVKHLQPLLQRAAQAGRVVILTADHGHIVERREGSMRTYASTSSNRSRDASAPAADGEILLRGGRILTDDQQAVLAVDERLRFGPLKAGYHGGAAPAEVIVPVTVLVAGPVPDGTGLTLAPPQEPAWWWGPVATPVAQVVVPSVRQDPPTLFDEPEVLAGPTGDWAASVLASPVYAEQRALAGRVAVTDQQVSALLTALRLSPDHRLPAGPAAAALGVPLAALRGAVPHVQRLLNVESYPVLVLDQDGSTLVLDAGLLREQFGLSS